MVVVVGAPNPVIVQMSFVVTVCPVPKLLDFLSFSFYFFKTVIRRGTCTLMFIAAMPTVAKLWKEPRCPLSDAWIKNM